MLGGSKWIGALAGLMALGGGWALKFTLVARAAYNQGFALKKLPVRGQGTPGPGVKPGWIPPMPGKR
jgi:phenylacetyl-CoA:acceptor oxidoreductase subunit 2